MNPTSKPFWMKVRSSVSSFVAVANQYPRRPQTAFCIFCRSSIASGD